MQGLFITLEGPEGAGKSTHLPQLCDWLRQQGHEVTQTRNPGGTEIGVQIRHMLLNPENEGMTSLTELLLYAADRAQHVAEVVKPALAEGGIVVCDRFTDSTVAYQGHGRGLSLELLNMLNGLATQGLNPDLTLVLDVEPALGLQRAALARSVDRMEQESLDFHERLRKGFLAIAEANPDRVVLIDANQDAPRVQDALRKAVSARLNARAAR